MKQKPPRWVQITAAVLRRYLALDMTVYAGSATLFLLTASFPLRLWRPRTLRSALRRAGRHGHPV